MAARAARTITRKHPSPLLERVGLESARVDRDARVIHRVKILGLTSSNGRRYTRDALRNAASLYEGAKVRANHPKKATDPRTIDDTLGWLANVTDTDDGLYGDLHYLESHPMSARLVEAAERNPGLYGLSHNANGITTRDRGGEVVSEITEVRSVDLVSDPATVGGLFEERSVKVKLKAFLEGNKAYDLRGRAAVRRLMEEGAMDPALDMPADIMPPPAEDAAPQDHEEALKGGFEASCLAVVQESLSGGMDPTEALKKLKELLTTHAKLSSGGEADTPTDDAGDDGAAAEDSPVEEEHGGYDKDEDDDIKGKGMKEQRDLKKRLRDLESREEVRELCESHGYAPAKPVLAALAALPNKAARESLIAELKGAPKRTPRTQVVTEGRTSRGTDVPAVFTDLKAFAEALKSGQF